MVMETGGPKNSYYGDNNIAYLTCTAHIPHGSMVRVPAGLPRSRRVLFMTRGVWTVMSHPRNVAVMVCVLHAS